MSEPLLWNTLSEAAKYLTEVTKREWNVRQVLNAALAMYKGNSHNSPPTCLTASLPRSTAFALYEWDAANTRLPTSPFVRKHSMPWQTVPLYPVHLFELLTCEETKVGIAQRPEDEYGQEGRYVFIEPLEESHIVGVGMVGISQNGLFWLADVSAGGKPDEKKLLPVQQDKLECQRLAKELWGKKPEETKAAIMQTSELAPYKRKYRGKNTLSSWLAEIDPRPKGTRRGRPSKNTRAAKK